LGVLVVTSILLGTVLLPQWTLIGGAAIALVAGGVLLTARRWEPWGDHTFGYRLPVSIRSLAAISVIASLTTLTGSAGELSTNAAIWIGLIGGSTFVLVGSLLRQEGRSPAVGLRVPAWLGLAGVCSIVGLWWLGTTSGSAFTPVFFLSFATFFVYLWFIVPLAVYQSGDEEASTPSEPYPSVSVLVPAYNEEGYVGRCLDHILDSDYPADAYEVIVIDDGSTDGTYEEARQRAGPNVTVHSKSNEGKHAALNDGLELTNSDIVVVVDADSFVQPDALSKAVATLQSDSATGAVASDVKVLNRQNSVSRIQTLEYILGINTLRRAFDFFRVVPVVPGCLGAFRREALLDAGGYDDDTLTEDFDVTIKILRAGWAVRHTSAAVWTEAPYSWRDLYRQRLRWNRGNIEVLRKHWRVLMSDESRHLHRLVFPFLVLTMLLAPLVAVVVLVVVGASLLSGAIATLASMLLYFILVGGLLSLLVIQLEAESVRLLPYSIPFAVLYPLFQAAVLAASVLSVLREADSRWDSVRRMAQDPATER
jgi:cellulose synthase/poly-beta-1,6-N-acetylglucosamine synthase-like glycosyltransferase